MKVSQSTHFQIGQQLMILIMMAIDDIVAQTKLIFGLLTGVGLYVFYLLLLLPLLPITLPLFPVFFWLSLRWMEDLMSSLRASLALLRLLSLGKGQLLLLRQMREGLRERVERIAIEEGLPQDPNDLVMKTPRWKRALHAGFFSVRTRRKKGSFFNNVAYSSYDTWILMIDN
jgi:glycerol-3-phosphate O-acyltransferase/dihydroxyacetone phosphate acyltransferase